MKKSSHHTSSDSSFGRGQWIWPVDHRWDLHNAYVLFRYAFTLDRIPRKAPLFITADQSYQLYINGVFVGRGPARGFQSHWPYDKIDVAERLLPGRNVIAVRAYNPGQSNCQYLSETHAGLLVAAKWGRTRIQTDATWKCLPQPGIQRDTTKCSLQLFFQEHYDARVGIDDWMQPDFDDSGWLSPLLRPQGSLPWSTLEPRGIPQMFEESEGPGTVIGIGKGACGSGWETARNLYVLRQEEDHAHPPVCKREAGMEAAKLKVPSSGKGKFRSYLIDVGRPVVGNFSLSIDGARGGETIDIIYVEDVDLTIGEPRMDFPDGCCASFGNRLVCRPGHTEHRFYHPFGFRYAMLTVRDSRGPVHLSTRLHRTGYPVERRGRFASSDSLLEQIWETCAWSQQNCMLDAYVDTPWREQAQWWGDARVQAWNTFHLSGDARLFHRGIRQIGAQTTADGLTYGHAPTMAHNCILPDFTLIWIITMWDYYWQTGDLDLFKRHRTGIDRALDYFDAHTGKQGLVEYDPRYWLFLDWTDLFKDGVSTVYNLWLLIALDKLTELHRLTGDVTAADHRHRWARALRRRLRQLINPRGLLRDGIDARGRIVATTSAHAQTLALMANLAPGSATRMEAFLMDYLRDETKHKARPSAYWITYVYSVLAGRGQGAAVVEHIKPRWKPMIAYGSTFEVFGDYDEIKASRSHAWSAHPLFHFMQIIGGIRQTAPAWKEITFAPVFIGNHGGATVPTPQGDITSAWKRKDGTIKVTLQLPSGVSAKVILPGKRPQQVTGDQQWTINAMET